MSIEKKLIPRLLLIFFATRIIYTLVGFYARENYLDKSEPFPSWTYESDMRFLNVWTSWDSGFYKYISETGYPKIIQPGSKAVIEVEPGTWIRVFLGYGTVGPDRVQLPSSGVIPYNNNLFLLGAQDTTTKVELDSVCAGLPYCVYRGPIDYDRDVKSTTEALLPESTACGGIPCDITFLTYFSAADQKIIYQEYFSKTNLEVPAKNLGEFRPQGFTDEPFQGLGCKTLTESDLTDSLATDVTKTTSPYPFMPLFPYVTKFLSYFFGDTILSGLILSNLAFFFSIIVFYKLISLDFDQKTSYRITLAYIFYPFMFLSSAFLTEGIFNLLLFLSLYLVRTRSYGKSAAVFALLAVTRINGVFAIIPLLYFLFLQEKNNLVAAAKSVVFIPAFIPLGLHIIHLIRMTGDPFVILTAQRGFGREGEGVMSGLIRYFLSNNEIGDFEFVILVFAVYLCAMALLNLRKDGKISYMPYLLLCLYSFFLPLSTGQITSFPRFSLGVFPIFIGMGTLIKDGAKFKWFVGGSFVLSLIFMALWTLSSRYVM